MVSFFGLKLGGDKKKQQTKQPQPQQQWKRIDQNTLGEGQYFGTELKRPVIPSSRPGSSQSATGPPALWNTPYAGPTLTSSMVDLSLPAPGRKQSFSSLRNVNKSSDSNLTTRWANGSAIDLTPPSAFANGGSGTPKRPGTSSSMRKKEWVNPLDVHFCKPFAGGSRPGSSARNSFAKPPPRNSVGPSEAAPKPSTESTTSSRGRQTSSPESTSTHTRGGSNGTTAGDAPRSVPAASIEPQMSQTGYPSPPKSISPISTADSQALFSKPVVPSSLRKVDVARLAGPQSPPSPASSASPTMERSRPQPELEDEEDWALPVIQDVRAKRDTLTYHPPRRQSFTMEVESHGKPEPTKIEAPTQARTPTPTQKQPERGEERSPDEPRIPARRERKFDMDPELVSRPKTQQVEGLSGNFDAFDFGDSVRKTVIERPKQDEPEEPASPSPRSKQKIDVVAARNHPGDRMPSAPGAWRPEFAGDAENDVPVMARGRPRFDLAPPHQSRSTPSSPARPQRPDWHGPPRSTGLPVVPPPPRASSRPGAPDGMSHTTLRQGGPPRAAAGAHQGGRDRMGYGPTALNPPPPARGFQPQPDQAGRSHNRAPPPRPLRVPGPVVDLRRSPDHPPLSPLSAGGPLSSEAPLTGESDYSGIMDNAPKPLTERPPTSPYSRMPMEGEFPTHKGLPRGRRPDPPPGESFEANSPGASSRWRQFRSSFARSPTSESSPRPQQQPQDQREVSASPDHGYALPNWDDFEERADRHRSALPPPLTPFAPPYSPYSVGAVSSSSIASPTPPRLPSPTFPSLEKSISSSNENLAKTFELFYEDSSEHIIDPIEPHVPKKAPLISPVSKDFSEPGPRRVEATKAPPRPAPITVPPSAREGLPGSEFGMRSPGLVPSKEFSAGFI